MPVKPSIKVGDRFITKQGELEVLEYHNKSNVVIKFLDDFGYETSARTQHIKESRVRNPYHKSVYGAGYIGEGPYKTSENGSSTMACDTWRQMIRRCYCKSSFEIYPTYENCWVDDRWHNFQNFAEWYYQQPNHSTKGFQLDKDLLVLGNKVYSPGACSLVPGEVNSLLTDRGRARGDYPQGVHKYQEGKYKAQIMMRNKKKGIGYYKTPEEAHEAYKKEKAKYVKQVAERYKKDLHPVVYQNLLNWSLSGGG